jgi:hypothetical protein
MQSKIGLVAKGAVSGNTYRHENERGLDKIVVSMLCYASILTCD